MHATVGNETKLAVHTFLRQWRDFRGMTQEQLAEAIGQTPPSISQMENGKQGFTDKSLAALATALQCTPAELLAVNPEGEKNFLPLFEAAERLEGHERLRVYRIIRAAVAPDEDESG